MLLQNRQTAVETDDNNAKIEQFSHLDYIPIDRSEDHPELIRVTYDREKFFDSSMVFLKNLFNPFPQETLLFNYRMTHPMPHPKEDTAMYMELNFELSQDLTVKEFYRKELFTSIGLTTGIFISLQVIFSWFFRQLVPWFMN